MRVNRPGNSRPRGFTLLEMLVTLTIIAIVATMVIPAFRDDSLLRVMAAASVMSSDIEMAQMMTIADPDRPVVVRFDPDDSRYWLARADDPDNPVAREDTDEPYLVVLGLDRAIAAAGVTFTVSGMNQSTLTFNEQGGLDDFTATPQITLAMDDETIIISVGATTGTITQTGG
ncbi:MAG: prepilin-type N-terminal cleavage/methylation domain-containing protein [Phycisphaerales bacterium]|nr:MAG: prepilin-type N-terminal cleavage/methylation domain-containing protein [Phycisphaerales bacterium]